MKKVIFPVLVVGVIVILGGIYTLSLYPVRSNIIVPSYINAPDAFGRITGFDDQNGINAVMFDEALWLTGEDAKDTPNGFKVEDTEAMSTNLFISPRVTVAVVDLSADTGSRTVPFNEFKKETEKDLQLFMTRYFVVSFDDQGRVSKISEQYVP